MQHYPLIYIGLGDHDSAFVWLEKGFKEHDGELIWLGVDPIYNSIRKDPRCCDILNRMRSIHAAGSLSGRDLASAR